MTAPALSNACRSLPHYLSHLDAPSLVEQQHPPRALFLGFNLLARLCADKKRGLWLLAARVGNLSEGVGARCEQHLADLAEFGRANGESRERVIGSSVVTDDQTVSQGPEVLRCGRRQ